MGPRGPARRIRTVFATTHTAIDVYRACPYRFFLTYLAGEHETGISPAFPSKPLVIGTLYHWGMAEILRGPTEGPRDWGASLDAALAAMDAMASSILIIKDPDRAVWTAHAKGLVEAHVAVLASGAETGRSFGRILSVERKFMVNLSPGVCLAGRIDAVTDHRFSPDLQGRWLIEHKSPSLLDGDYFRRVPVDGQVLRYAWALAKMGVPVTGVLYAVAVKLSPRIKKAETVEAFARRIRELYRERARDIVVHEAIVVNQTDITRCIQATRETLEEIQSRLQKELWPRHENACATKYGLCPYFGPCMQSRWDPRSPIPAGFREKTSRFEELEE